jgi:hypothetical protein
VPVSAAPPALAPPLLAPPVPEYPPDPVPPSLGLLVDSELEHAALAAATHSAPIRQTIPCRGSEFIEREASSGDQEEYVESDRVSFYWHTLGHVNGSK